MFCSASLQNGIVTFLGPKKSQKSDYGSYPEQGIWQSRYGRRSAEHTVEMEISIEARGLSDQTVKMQTIQSGNGGGGRTDTSLKRTYMWQISI